MDEYQKQLLHVLKRIADACERIATEKEKEQI